MISYRDKLIGSKESSNKNFGSSISVEGRESITPRESTKQMKSNGSCVEFKECTIPNCNEHTSYCVKCEKITSFVKVFKLSPIWNSHVDHYVPNTAKYVYDHICCQCRPKLEIDESYDRNIGSLFHNIGCYNKGDCICRDYYCSVKGCNKYSVSRNQNNVSYMSNDEQAKCSRHRIYCIDCEKETFWVIEHAFPQLLNMSDDDDYVCTETVCGPCYGYKQTK
jgi:hypothetical protein